MAKNTIHHGKACALLVTKMKVLYSSLLYAKDFDEGAISLGNGHKRTENKNKIGLFLSSGHDCKSTVHNMYRYVASVGTFFPFAVRVRNVRMFCMLELVSCRFVMTARKYP